MSTRPGAALARSALVAVALVFAGPSAPTAEAASSVASCKPSPTKAAKRLGVHAARHARLARAARRAARELRRSDHPLRARRARRRWQQHRGAVTRLRSRARSCASSGRHRGANRLVRFRRPLGGARLRGLINGPSCQAVARAGRQVDRVVFRLDGTVLNTERQAPYTCALDTTSVSNGWHWLEARAFGATGRMSVTRRRVNVANQAARRASGGAVGIEGGIRWRAGEDLVETVAKLRAAGATHTRESIAWYRVEPARGQWTFDAIDPWVGEAARQGLRIVAMLDGPPAWATGASDRQVAPVEGRALADYAHYARRLVERYGTSGTFWSENPDIPKLPIVHWNVWNEPYMPTFWHNSGEHAFPDPGGYARMFKAVATEAGKADPTAKFMAEVEISSVDPEHQPFLARMFNAVPDLAEHMDAAANHPYVSLDGRSPETCAVETHDMANRYNFCRVKTIRSMLDRRGARGAELWLTEFGYSTCPSCSRWSVGEQAQAQYVRDAFRLARQWAIVDGFIWWVYKTPEKDPSYAEDWMGLVRADDSPKPAWLAFAEEARRGL